MKNATSYKKLKKIEHLLARPGMYVGSCERIARKDWALVDGKAIIIPTETPISMFHLFKELTSNVADNVDESRKAGIPEGECTISVSGGRITISNGGLCIPIEMDKEHDTLIPVMIFSDMLSGSNLGEDRSGGGAHGIGCKAVGGLSSEFGVDIKNAVQRKSFSCTWRNNYSATEEPIIERYSGKESSVTISYVIDHKRFGYNERKFAYTEDDVSAFKWIAACLSFTAGIPVTFNEEVLNYDLVSYSKLYTEEDTKSFSIEQENLRCIVLDTPSRGKQIGFCNHIINTFGGTHTKAPLKLIKDHILADKKKGEVKLSLKDIKPHITVLISVTGVSNPGWGGGQMKTTLTSPNIDISCDDKILSKISSWGLMSFLDKKTFAKFGIVDPASKKGRFIETKSGEDATLAGTKQSHLCELHMVEGDSAEGYDADLMNFIPGGRRTVGTFMMRGKLLNVLKAPDEQIKNNRELNELAIRLGLKEVGTDYSETQSRKNLRYGKIVIMTDADEDGQHIKALILAFFHRFYPSLLKCGFIVDYITPYLRATKKRGGQIKKFFFEKQYEDWKKTVRIDEWSVRYFKGLGASTTEDIQQDYEDKHIIGMVYDSLAADRLELAMGKGEDATSLRKEWMLARDENASLVIGKKLPISEFIDFFMRNYSFSTLGRNMKTLADGLTIVARMIVFGTFNHFGRQCSSKSSPKVSDFAGGVGTLVKYHHGDSIQGSVITLAQDFVGSNNLPLLIGKGRFGTLEKGGKHAAQPRYIEVRPSPLLPLIFKPEDDALLVRREVEGIFTEPHFYLPIIPLSIINGADSVSTGWKSEIPNYNPLQVIDSYLARLNGKRFTELTPWYRGFRGTIKLRSGLLTCRGIVKFTSKEDYILTCLPVGIWNNKYKKYLLKKILAGDVSDYESQCTSTKTHFIVKKFKKKEEGRLTLHDIGAETNEKLSNLTLLGVNGLPIEYYNIAALMEDFYVFRLPLYTDRKLAMIKSLERELEIFKERKNYISAHLSGKLAFREGDASRKRAEVLADIELLGLKKEFYLSSGIAGYSEVTPSEMDLDGIASLENKMRKIEEKMREIRDTKEEEMWKNDLLELRKAYLKMYPVE